MMRVATCLFVSAFLLTSACSGEFTADGKGADGGGSAGTGGTAGSGTGGTGGTSTGGTSSGGTSGSATGGTAGSSTGGTAGSGASSSGGTAGSATGGTAGSSTGGTSSGGTAGSSTGGSAGSGGTAGSATGGTAGSTGGSAGSGGTAGSATGGTAGSTGGTGATQSGDCNHDSDCKNNESCVTLTPGGFRLCVKPRPEATACMNPGDLCCNSSECSGSKKCYPQPIIPHCGGIVVLDFNVCANDDCKDNGDCNPDQFCVPRGAFGNAVRYCAPAACHTDADCSQQQPSGKCAPVDEPCCGNPAGLYCVYTYPDRNGCRHSSDCEPGSYCEINGSEGRCDGGSPICPL